MSNGQSNPHTEALKHFKDWSNVLLVTTVAAVGWVSQANADLPTFAFVISLFSLAASVVFAIFTLALIPHVAENIQEESIYDVESKVMPVPDSWSEYGIIKKYLPITLRIKNVCWLQHILFILGVIAYALGIIICKLHPSICKTLGS